MLFKEIYRFWIVQFLLSLLLVSLTRLPYLLGQHVYFDGDEAIIGIMAQDLLDCKNIPVYFYGQQYGFSFFEVIGVAVGILIFGNTVFALKVGGILIYSIGLSFLLRLCIKHKINIFISLAIILVICCFPAWLLWSTKPRGGYVTAFSISCILLYIFQVFQPKFRFVIISSTLLGIGIHSQVFIIIPVAMGFIWWILREKKFNIALIAILFLSLSLAVFKLPALVNDSFWRMPMSLRPNFGNLRLSINEWTAIFNGSYFYEEMFQLGNTIKLLSGAYALFGLSSIFITIFSKKVPGKEYLLVLGIGGIISWLMISIMVGGTYRYMLGLFTAFILMVFLGMLQLHKYKAKLFSGITLTMLMTGIVGAWFIKEIPSFWVQKEKNDMLMFVQLTDELKSRNCQHVFMMDLMMQWMLNYSGISSRSTSKKERINRFSQSVDECYKTPGCTHALVGFVGYFNYSDSINDWNKNVTIVNERFFVYYYPKGHHLKSGGFEQ